MLGMQQRRAFIVFGTHSSRKSPWLKTKTIVRILKDLTHYIHSCNCTIENLYQKGANMKKRIAGALALIVLIGGLAQAAPYGKIVLSNGGTAIVIETDPLPPPPPPPPTSSRACGSSGC
jgi:hypothetical protein